MTVPLNCPACGQEFVGDDRAGRSARCPACDSVISTAGARRSVGITARPSAARPAANRPRMPPPRRRRATTNGGTIALILGIIALVLGVPALAISWVPFLCAFGLICAGIGLLAGIAGVVAAVIQKGDGLSVSLAGGSVNLVALMVALFMSFVTGALVAIGEEKAESASTTEPRTNPLAAEQPQNPPRPGGQPVAVGLTPDWGQRIDPDRDCAFRERAGELEVTVPPTPHDLSIELGRINAPRVLQDVVGDFAMQVKVCGSLRPTTPGSVAGRVAYQAGGLLVWSDERNYLRLERAGLSRNGAVNSYAAFEQRVNGLPGAARSLGIEDQDSYLRVERRGDQFRAFASSDGQQWKPLEGIEAAFPERLHAGIVVINAAQQQLQLRFAELRIGR